MDPSNVVNACAKHRAQQQLNCNWMREVLRRPSKSTLSITVNSSPVIIHFYQLIVYLLSSWASVAGGHAESVILLLMTRLF